MQEIVPYVITTDNVIQISTTAHRELSRENLDWLIENVLEAGKTISKNVGENWFPCGFANLNVAGNSPFVRFMKKYGEQDRSWYKYGAIRISKGYPSGYNIYFDYPSTSAVESQSLNFKTPLYTLFQRMLALLNVSASLQTMVD